MYEVDYSGPVVKRTFEGLGRDTLAWRRGRGIGVESTRGVGGGRMSTWENSVGFSFGYLP